MGDQLEATKTKIRKLIAHEQSAKKIGNFEEAAAYTAGIKRLLRKHKLTRKALAEMPKPSPAPQCLARVDGTWQCTCGFKTTLRMSGSEEFVRWLVNSTFGSHIGGSHKLTKVA